MCVVYAKLQTACRAACIGARRGLKLQTCLLHPPPPELSWHCLVEAFLDTAGLLVAGLEGPDGVEVRGCAGTPGASVVAASCILQEG